MGRLCAEARGVQVTQSARGLHIAERCEGTGPWSLEVQLWAGLDHGVGDAVMGSMGSNGVLLVCSLEDDV